MAVFVQVGCGKLHPGHPVGDEHRPGRPALQQPGQEPGGTCLPGDPVDGAAFPPYPGAAVGEVPVLDVEREHLGRPGRALVEHPPHGALSEADVLAGEQLLDVGAVQGAGAVRPRPAALELAGDVGGEPALALPVGGGRPGRIEGNVPRGRRPLAPLLAEPGGEPFRIDPGRVGAGAEFGHDPAEHPAIGAAGAGVLGAAERGQVSVSSLAERDGGAGRDDALDGCDTGTLSEVMAPITSGKRFRPLRRIMACRWFCDQNTLQRPALSLPLACTLDSGYVPAG
jgi:hypothetical protein